MFRIFHLDDCPTVPMKGDRGEQVRLINAELGTGKLDVHVNRLKVGDPGGSYHHHSNADNVYIVKRGEGELVVEGETHVIRADELRQLDEPILPVALDLFVADFYSVQRHKRPGAVEVVDITSI